MNLQTVAMTVLMGASLASACASGPDAAGGKAGQMAPAVRTARSLRRDVPRFVQGIGTVNAFYTVTVHPQVDGRIEAVLFAEGQSVRKGDPLVRIDPRPFAIAVKNAEAALARDRALLHNAKLNLQRFAPLASRHLVAQQQLTDQDALVQQYAATVQLDEAALASAQLQLEYAHITAPIDGVTGLRIVDPGSVVHASDTNGLLMIAQLDPIAVIFSLPEDDFAALRSAMAAGAVQAEAFARDGNTPLAIGKLAVVDNQINVQSGSLKLKATFANPEHILWPNQFVRVRLQLGVDAQALVVPVEAISSGIDGAYVFVVDGQNVAHRRAVKVTRIDGAQAIIQEGLNEGDQVVVDGQANVRDNAATRPQTADGQQASHPP